MKTVCIGRRRNIHTVLARLEKITGHSPKWGKDTEDEEHVNENTNTGEHRLTMIGM